MCTCNILGECNILGGGNILGENLISYLLKYATFENMAVEAEF